MHTICQGIWENTSENHMAEQNNNRLLEEKKKYLAYWNYKITILTGQQIKDSKSCPKIFKEQSGEDTKTSNATFQL